MFDLDFGWHQAMRARTVAEAGRSDVARLAYAIRSLEQRVETQAVVLQALGKLLAERFGMTDAEILDYVRRAESEREALATPTCVRCGHRLPPRKTRCIYCGEDHSPQSVGQTL